MSLLDIVPDVLEAIGEKLKPKPPKPDEPSALDKVWKQQLEDEKATAERRKRKPKAKAVMVFGRFNPPTTGHARLIAHMNEVAEREKAMPFLFTSVKQDADNPLPFAVKVEWLKRLFHVPVYSNPKVTHPLQALAVLQTVGFEQVTIVVGSDQTKEFERIADYCRRKGVLGSDPTKRKPLTNVTVETVPGERDGRHFGVSGMSATKLRKAAKAKNFQAFKTGVPTNSEAVARKLYFQVRKAMGLAKGHTFLLCGFTLNDAKQLRETFGQLFPRVKAFDQRTNALLQNAKPFYMDLSGYNYGQVSSVARRLAEANYKTTIYAIPVPLPKQLTEAYVKSASTVGMLNKGGAVMVEDAACALAHARKALKEEGEAPKPKEPTEVDRLKTRQKSEVLAMKQRQGNDLLQAKQRELQKKSREDQQKIAQSAKPKSA